MMNRNHRFPSLSTQLTQPVDSDLLVYFRVIFALVGLSWVAKQFSTGAIEQFYVLPNYHFHYYGFHWVEPFPEPWTTWEFIALGIASLGMLLGLFYRLSAFVWALGFTHLFLADKCLYQNHYYLICLVSWLMVLMPANRSLAVDAVRKPAIASQTVPIWTIWLLRFQMGVPYFFGGFAKVSPDWLAGEPMRFMLSQRTDFPLLGQYFREESVVYLFAYGAMLFDLLVVPALLSKRFRLAGCLFSTGFHLMNAYLFTIGVFPWLMLLSLVLFFPPGTVRRALTPASTPLSTQPAEQPPRSTNWLVPLIVIYVTWQVCFPLRHLLMPGTPNWTEEGHYFAWHMLLRGKTAALRYNAIDASSGRSGAMDLRPYVTEFQLSRLSRDPRMIHQLAQIIGVRLRSEGFHDVRLQAVCLVSMNGRKPQLLVDPNVNLLNENVGWRRPDWIVPLSEPLRHPHWDRPISEWEVLLK